MFSKLILLALFAGIQCAFGDLQESSEITKPSTNSCANKNCAVDQVCILKHTVCFRAPCSPQPTCVSKTEICSMPMVVGRCKAALKMWYYDSASQTCKPLAYSGCGGNYNRFKSEEYCNEFCGVTPASDIPRPIEHPVIQKDICSLLKVTGPCRAAFRKWYYDSASHTCKMFTYGGCKGNGNRFESQADCEKACSTNPANIAPPVEQEDVCSLPKVTGPCRAAFRKWYYDSASHTCNMFTYGGCKGNGNRFESQADCEKACSTNPANIAPPVEQKDICSLPKVTGPCEAAFRKWYYDSASHTCKMFTYGGCKGNGNQFESQADCEKTCSTNPANIAPPVEQEDVCSLPKVTGPCRAAFRKWYYDSASHTCKMFTYGGCKGNGNRFESQADCEKACSTNPANIAPPVEQKDVCSLPKVTGPCWAAFRKWYYDSASRACKMFTYGGCRGNENRFKSEADCEKTCSTKSANPAPAVEQKDVCSLPKVTGPCRAAFRKWYYDSASRACKMFTYGGCRGNENRFESEADCEKACSTKPAKPEPAVEQNKICSLPKVTGPCRAAFRKWYYNTARKSCEMFTYGGCRGNENRFDSLDACNKVCSAIPPPAEIKLTKADACYMPKVVGPCKVAIRSWYYDSAEHECKMFMYGGCSGNKNRFRTWEECNKLCASAGNKTGHAVDIPDPAASNPCTQPKMIGTANGKSRKWFFDAQKKKCRRFAHGSSGGNSNNFPSRLACKKACGQHTVPIRFPVRQ